MLEETACPFLQAPVRLAFANQPLNPAELCAGERDCFDRLRADARRDAWLRGRRALKQVLQELGLDLDTARLRFPHPRLSLSHSGKISVAAGADDLDLAGLGVDFETARSLPPESARLFLAPEEQRRAVGPDSLLRLWTVKEACFKADLQNESTRFADYVVEDPGAWAGAVRTPCGARIGYCSLARAGGFLTIAVADVEGRSRRG